MLTLHDRSALALETLAPVTLIDWAAIVRFSLLVWGPAACLGCGKITDTVAVDGTLAAASGAGAGEGSGGVSTTPSDQCGDSYPQLLWPGETPHPVCTASFARGRMSQALCSCGDAASWGGVRTDAFDSIAKTAEPGAAAVGINGAYVSPSPLWGGGSVTIAAKAALTIPLLDVHGDLRLAGTLDVGGPLTVTGDAWFAESVTARSLVTIGGTVHQAPGKTLEAAVPLGTSQLIAEEFGVAPPCRCDENQILDWTSVIDSASEQNDNASIGLTAEAVSQPAAAIALTLPCGRYYLSGIASNQDVHLVVVGRVALFVAGDVSSTGPLRVELAPGAELDWFIGGKLDLASTVQLGDAERPAATRVYVAGGGELNVPEEYVWANLYAPRADVVLPGESAFSGSVFGQTVSSAKDIAVHYDQAVQRVADGCPLDDPQSCSGCGQCGGGRTCLAGSCAGCTADADCCWPLVCDGGRCAAFAE
jgi:hypothetical protein